MNRTRFTRKIASLSLVWLISAAGWVLPGCDFKLPTPPPDLFYKYNVIPVGQGPAYLLSVDLNSDGNADIVSANAKDSTVSILFGKGDGTFAANLTVRVPAEPTALAAGDLNNDGLIDLLVNARGAHMFSALLGNKNGGFEKLKTQKTGRVPLSLILADYNNDGILDAAVTLTFDKMELYLGWGIGRFKKGETYLTGSRSFSGVAADFDRDGNQDIALAASSSNASSIRLFRGNGDGTFKKPSQIAHGLVPLTLIKKDMNADGLPDLVCASGKGDNLYMFYSNGDGTFKKEIPFAGGGGPISLAAEDFNDDGLVDVAVANSRSSNFSLVVRMPGGLFRYPTRDYVVDGGTVLAITSADFNDDGMKDIAVASNAKNTVEIYLRRKIFK
ncbi:MAG: VCBS repeat-containing protein [Nitrospinaceae bacterium]